MEHRPILTGLLLKTLEPATSKSLECNFSEEDINLALEELAGDTATGPDGFPLKFYKLFWLL